MILTGEAKEYFELWFNNYSQEHHRKEWLKNDLYLDEVYLPETLQHALIIYFFDNQGIYITIRKSIDKYWFYDIQMYGMSVHISALTPMDDSRQEATKQAILKANEIYNARHINVR